jgi:hypothetical protein
MSDRQTRREKLREKMIKDAANRDSGSGIKILDLSDFEDVPWFKAKKGKNEIDILPFEVTSNNDPAGTTIGDDNYKLDYYQHKDVGPNNQRVICLNKTFNKPCPICEARKAMIDEGVAWDSDEAKALNSSRRCVYNIIDINDTAKGVQLFEQSHYKFEKELFGAAEYKNPDFICFADIEEGYTVSFRGSEETFNKNKFIEPKDFDFAERDPYEEDIYKDVYPLDAMLVVPTYTEVQNLFLGVDEKDEEGDSEKTIEKTLGKAPSTRKKKSSSNRKEAKEGRQAPESKGRRRKQAEPEPEPEEEQEDIFECPEGFICGQDFCEKDECQTCEDDTYNKCKDNFEALEDAQKEAKEKEEAEKLAKTKKTETKPKRPRRR